jgi:radical SAM superfamily enzyme YgiQ (UPF0313 family)
MNVVLINPTPADHYSPCIRALASMLKINGHKVRQVFLPADTYAHLHVREGFIMQLADSMIDDLVSLCKDADFVGVSFLTSMFDVAVQATRAIQKKYPEKIIAWGGFHPTTMPQQALEFVDIVCVGEGDYALLELIERIETGKDYYDVRNFWFRKSNGKVTGNPHRPLVQNLDELPFQDYSFHDDWSYDDKQEHMVPLTWELFLERMPRYTDRNGDMRYTYKTMITRGCPHKCSYCGVAFNHDLYKGQTYLRRRSVEHIIGEIKTVVCRFPEIGLIHFQDDVFFSTSYAEIKRFSDAWKKEIGLPFRAQCSPSTITEEKYEALIEAGLSFTEMGIQTGSRETMRMYRRGMTNNQVLKAAEIIAKHTHRTQIPDFHVILDNPWETGEDVLKGLRLLWQLPTPYNLLPSSLVPYPGTEFYHKVIDDGFVSDEYNQIYRKEFHSPAGKYVNFLFFLSIFNNFPKEALHYLAQDKFMNRFNQKQYDPFWGVMYKYGEYLRRAQKLSTFAVKGKLLEITKFDELKRVANQMK